MTFYDKERISGKNGRISEKKDLQLSIIYDILL